MLINEEQLKNFQEMHRARFGVEISRQEALESGIALITLMKTILSIIPKK